MVVAVHLPDRGVAARARLHEVAGRVRPTVAAGDRLLRVSGPLGSLLPAGGVQRGSTVAVDGAPGAGVTSLACALAAAATETGEWAAIVDPAGTFGARFAAEAGVELERCAVVRNVPSDRWSTVVSALLDGVALVAATVPLHLRTGDARRLVARARERASVLVAIGPWPAEAALRVRAEGSAWSGATRTMEVSVETRGRRQVQAVAG